MKKVISIVLCLFLVIALAACGDNREKMEEDDNLSTAEDVKLWKINGRYCETTNGRSLLLSEDEISEATTFDICPAIMVNGEIYFDTGHKSTVTGRCGNMDGQITSECSSSETPSINDQSNFGTGYGYQYGGREGTIEVLLDDGEWYVFATEDVKANWNVFEDLVGKTFIYEGEGLQGDDFTITFNEYTFSYSEGRASSHLGFGTWSIEGNMITLVENDPEMKNNFEINDNQLTWMEKGSDNFIYVKLTDGAVFQVEK